MKSNLKSVRLLILLLLITSAISVNAKSRSAKTTVAFYELKQMISPYFRAPQYVAGDYWGVGLIIQKTGTNSYQGSARIGLFNNHVYKPGYYIPGGVTVYGNLTTTPNIGGVSAYVPAGQEDSTPMSFNSTSSPVITYSGSTPGYFGTAPNEVPIQYEGTSYQ